MEPTIGNIIRPSKINLSKSSFEPSALGFKLGSVDFERSSTDLNLGLELNAVTDAILEELHKVIKVNNFPPILLHFDELDRGLTSLDDQRAEC